MNTLITWNQFREMEKARQNRFNRFFAGFPNRMGSGEPHSLTVADWSPEVDISEDDHEYLLKADLPDMKKDDVRVTVEDGILCVSGERKSVKEDQKKKFHRIERSFGNFRRSFTLPADADSTKVTAEFRDGVLKVHLPTTTVAKSKPIEVKVFWLALLLCWLLTSCASPGSGSGSGLGYWPAYLPEIQPVPATVTAQSFWPSPSFNPYPAYVPQMQSPEYPGSVSNPIYIAPEPTGFARLP